jgi:sulfonate transport system substrate-binding protein
MEDDMSLDRRAFLSITALTVAATLAGGGVLAADKPKEIGLDYAYYNPVSLVLKEKGWVEEEFAKDGIGVRWVLSLGSNKALEYLNGRSIDFGSTAGGAALLGRINGNPIKSVYVYSRPEWTALVTRIDSPIQSVEELKGKRIAVTRGTDPYIFLIRALAGAGLGEKDVQIVLLQHPDGKTALERGDVDAWSGLDPHMAQTEIEGKSRLFYRDPDANTWGVLNVREEFAAEHPDLVERLIAVYERGRAWAIENPDELRRILAKNAKLTDEVAARQLERTDLSHSAIGAAQRESILAAGEALKSVGIVPADVDITVATDALLEPAFTKRLAGN